MCVRAVLSSRSPFFTKALIPFSSTRHTSSFWYFEYGFALFMVFSFCSSDLRATIAYRRNELRESSFRASPSHPSDPCAADQAASYFRRGRGSPAIRAILPIPDQIPEDSFAQNYRRVFM